MSVSLRASVSWSNGRGFLRSTKLSNRLGQVVQLPLQRGIIRFLTRAHHRLSEAAVDTNSSHHVCTNTLKNLRSRNDERVQFVGVAASGIVLCDSVLGGHLLHLVGFTGCGRLVALDIVTSNEDAVGGNEISRLQVTNITHQ